MNPIKKTLTSTKEFVSAHKTAITIIATATVTTITLYAVARATSSGYTETVNDFLKEKGLLDEFNFVTFDADH